MILGAIIKVNGARRKPQATPGLVAELLGPGGRSANPRLDIPLPESDHYNYVNPGLIRSRIAHLIRSGFLEVDRAGRIYLPEIPGRLL